MRNLLETYSHCTVPPLVFKSDVLKWLLDSKGLFWVKSVRGMTKALDGSKGEVARIWSGEKSGY